MTKELRKLKKTKQKTRSATEIYNLEIIKIDNRANFEFIICILNFLCLGIKFLWTQLCYFELHYKRKTLD